MDELRDLVTLAVPTGSRVLAVAPDPALLKGLSARACRTWSLVADDGPTLAPKGLSEGVAVCDLDRLDVADAFPGLEFDVVVLPGALASVAFPAELLQRVSKVLTAEGRLVASVPNATNVSRRIRAWEGLDQEEVTPGRPLRRAFTGPMIEQLLRENGLFTIETLRVPGRSPGRDVQPAELPAVVLAFLSADGDAGTDHYVIVASPAAGLGEEPVSLAEEMQRRLHHADDELAERRADMAALERELEALQVDLALKDDFVLQLRGQIRTSEDRAARFESEVVDARASLDAARHQLAARELELAELRRLAGRGVLSLILHRLLGAARPTR